MFIGTTSRPSITMYDMDGRNKKVLLPQGSFPMSLAVHPTKTLLYWVDPRAGMISFKDYMASR